MATIQVELNEKALKELDALIQKGWFANQAEVVRLALAEFLGRNRLTLLEQFQQEDILWALEQQRKPEDRT